MFVEGTRTDLVVATVVEKQATAHGETATIVPSEGLYSSRSSPLDVAVDNVRRPLVFLNPPTQALDVYSDLDGAVLNINSV